MQPHLIPSESPEPSSVSPPLERRILSALAGLQYGAVEITVHEGKVVQIERREKFRFPSQAPTKN